VQGQSRAASFAGVLTKGQSKDIKALATARGRREQGRFAVEGDKMVRELLASGAAIERVLCVTNWAEQHRGLLRVRPDVPVQEIKPSEMEALTALISPPEVLLIAPIPAPPASLPTGGWVLGLDTIQDPGNLGTILRIADWFGVPDIVCSPGCADAWGPKVVAAGMGAHLRVRIHAASLENAVGGYRGPVLAAALDGEDVTSAARLPAAMLLIGNEGRGLPQELLDAATKRVRIPGRGGAESLNAAVSTGILCAMLIGD